MIRKWSNRVRWTRRNRSCHRISRKLRVRMSTRRSWRPRKRTRRSWQSRIWRHRWRWNWKRLKLCLPFFCPPLVTSRKTTTSRKETSTIASTCKNVSAPTTTFPVPYKLSTINTKKSPKPLTRPAITIRALLPPSGTLMMSWNFRRKASLKSYRKRLRRMWMRNLETTCWTPSPVSVSIKTLFKSTPSMKYPVLHNISWRRRTSTRGAEPAKYPARQASPTVKAAWPKYPTFNKSHTMTLKTSKTPATANSQARNPAIGRA